MSGRLCLIRAEELEVLVTGTQELDFGELAKATEYDGGFDKDHPTVQAFWLAVADMPPEEQRRLLMFVTGSKKVRDTLRLPRTFRVNTVPLYRLNRCRGPSAVRARG